MIKQIAVIDYGLGNLYSVSKAFGHLGFNATITSDPLEILSSERVVLPGVGAFNTGMKKLTESGLIDVIKQVAQSERPLLGICLGAQMLFERSDEFGSTAGLGLLKGEVIPIPRETSFEQKINVPHIGWNNLIYSNQDAIKNRYSILKNIPEQSMTYFVHSYMMEPLSTENRIADVDYHGLRIAAIVGRDNVIGTQFHPEKSGDCGLQILRNFCEA